MSKILNSSLSIATICAVALPIALSLPASAEDSVMTEFRNSLKVANSKRFRERIENSKKQVESATSKNWLSSDQAEQYNQECARVSQMEQDVAAKGFPKEETDPLEQAVTALNQKITTGIASAAAAKTQTASEEEKDAQNTSAKSNKSVKKHKKHRRQA